MYFANETVEALHRSCDAFLIGRSDLAQIFRVHASGQSCDHECLTALSGVLRLRPLSRAAAILGRPGQARRLQPTSSADAK